MQPICALFTFLLFLTQSKQIGISTRNSLSFMTERNISLLQFTMMTRHGIKPCFSLRLKVISGQIEITQLLFQDTHVSVIYVSESSRFSVPLATLSRIRLGSQIIRFSLSRFALNFESNGFSTKSGCSYRLFRNSC